MEKHVYNCHTHSFTLDDVPEEFFKGIAPVPIKISWLKKSSIVRRIIKWFDLPFFNRYPYLIRLVNFVKHAIDDGKVRTQVEIIRTLQSYYPKDTRFVILTMDMDYMVSGTAEAKSNFYEQLKDLHIIKKDKEFQDFIYPFIHTDPRRLANDKLFLPKVEEYIRGGTYTGIKIYPALGYFPFDKALKPVYDLALEYELPIMTHCTNGTVFFRGSRNTYSSHNEPFLHPRTKRPLQGTKSKEFTQHFTHPLNYQCLTEENFIASYWNIGVEEAKKYKKLKICLGHYGGAGEWLKYLQDPWLPDTNSGSACDTESWFHNLDGKPADKGQRDCSWFSVISDMLKQEGTNFYADISYSLSDQRLYPLLKVMLQTDEALKKRILFGTDFYVVAKAGSERELSINLRGYLGEELFWQIANKNPESYLTSKNTARNSSLGMKSIMI